MKQLRIERADVAEKPRLPRVAEEPIPFLVRHHHVGVDLGPIALAIGCLAVRHRDQLQHTARRGESILDVARGRTEVSPHSASPDLGIRVGIVAQPSPKPVGVEVLLEIMMRRELGVGVSTAAAGKAGALTPFEKKWFGQFDPRGAAEDGVATIPGEGRGIAAEQETLRAGPDAKHHVPGPVLGEQVRVSVAGEGAVANQ